MAGEIEVLASHPDLSFLITGGDSGYLELKHRMRRPPAGKICFLHNPLLELPTDAVPATHRHLLGMPVLEERSALNQHR